MITEEQVLSLIEQGQREKEYLHSKIDQIDSRIDLYQLLLEQLSGAGVDLAINNFFLDDETRVKARHAMTAFARKIFRLAKEQEVEVLQEPDDQYDFEEMVEEVKPKRKRRTKAEMVAG